MRTIELSWSEFKTDIIDKGFPINYRKESYDIDPTKYGYEVFVVDRGLIYWVSHIIEVADVLDFETNYKANANKNLEYDLEGKRISGPKYSEAQVLTALAIRDTSPHNSNNSVNFGYKVKTIIINNQLDQAVTCQCQGSRDGTNWFNVGATWSVSATTLTFETCESYFPYFRTVVTCAIAPTTGAIDMWYERMGL
jgi:hypothetical protein